MYLPMSKMPDNQLNTGARLGLADSHTRRGSSEGGKSAVSPSKGRSLSDTVPPVLSPSPAIKEPEKTRAKDDTAIDNSPTTPRRPPVPVRGLSLQMPARDLMPAYSTSAYSRTPLSPKLDVGDPYASPVIPRRSRGLDFSRAATNLHHSTLAEVSSPDSSPTISGRAMNIPNRRSGQFAIESINGSSASLWSTRPSDRSTISSSLGSVNMFASESSESSSDENDAMDADEFEEAILTTPQVQRVSSLTGAVSQPSPGSNWMGNSPAVRSLMNFQRARLRNRKTRQNSGGSGTFKAAPKQSPPIPATIDGPANAFFIETPSSRTHSRRESISWAANQLHISGNESDDAGLKNTVENSDSLSSTPGRDGQRGVVKRAVTRRGNMLPKTKGFARIRAALAEESTPLETEVRREANVIRQVRASEMDLEPARNRPNSTQSSPSMSAALGDYLDDIPGDEIMADSAPMDLGLSSSFKQHAMLNSKGKEFWERFPDDHTHRTPPPPFLQRHSSSVMSDEIAMYSPSLSAQASTTDGILFLPSQSSDPSEAPSQHGSNSPTRASTPLPAAAEVGRTLPPLNKKRRRDEDFDPTSFKRRAVSPGMSVQNSPVTQSPMQRDVNPWGTRPPSNSGSEKGNVPSEGSSGGGQRLTGSKRVGLQGLVDTNNDCLMKMSIEKCKHCTYISNNCNSFLQIRVECDLIKIRGPLIHDRWSCFAHGVPTHIIKFHYEFPAPNVQALITEDGKEFPARIRAAECFIALCTLTEILGDILPLLYDRRHQSGAQVSRTIRRVEVALDDWED